MVDEDRPAKKSAARKESEQSARADRDEVVGGGEFRSRKAARTALITGNTFHSKAVQYAEIDGYAMFEGDIVLGTVSEVEQISDVLAAEERGEVERSVIITGAQYRWPNCEVPYDIDPNLSNQQRVTDAISHWQTHTNFKFTLRTAANAAQYPDWVTFRPWSGCSSSVGKRGGQQFVNLGSSCTTGNTIHEIGHTVGLWHEQSREDRDAFVTIHWDKIQAGLEFNFNQHISDGDDIGAYDYGSIMHYPRDAFSIDGSDTITPKDPAAVIGQRTALSAGDIAGAAALCNVQPPKLKDTIKEKPKELIKERVKETLGKERPKEIVKERPKELIKEQPKEFIKEHLKEPVKEFSEATVAERIPGPNQRIGPINVASPFALATSRGPGIAEQQEQAGAAGVAEPAAMADPQAMLAQLAVINGALEANATVAETLLALRDQVVESLRAHGWL